MNRPKDGQEDDSVFISAGDGLIVRNQEPLTFQLLLETIHRLQSDHDEAKAERAFIETEYAAANESDLTRDALCLQVASLRALIREAHRELSTIEAITVSPSDTDGLIQLCKRLADAGKSSP